MDLNQIISTGIASLSVLAIFSNAIPGFVSSRNSVAQVETTPTTITDSNTTESLQSPKRLRITVNVDNPEDLKIEEGQEIAKGQIIADRTRERQRLESQKQQLIISLTKLQSSTITKPLPPLTSPEIKPLPPNSYLEEEAAIARSKSSVAGMGEKINDKQQITPYLISEKQAEVEAAKVPITSVDREIELKQQEINYLKQLPDLDPIILEHEQVKLGELLEERKIATSNYELARRNLEAFEIEQGNQLREIKRSHTDSVRKYQLSLGKLSTAKDERAYQEYLASVSAARRVEEQNQSLLSYQRQLGEYEQRVRDKDYQISQLKVRLNEVENAIANLSTIKAPYGGEVRRVKWLGQGSDGRLSVEVTLMVENPKLN